jgi:hypothetical protein
MGLAKEIGRRRLFHAQRLARHGRRHPDPEVDALAVRWAQSVLSSPSMYPELQAMKTLIFKVMITDGVTGKSYGKYQIALMDRTDRRHARNILQAHGITSPDDHS